MARWFHSNFGAARTWAEATAVEDAYDATWGTDANSPNTGESSEGTVPKLGGTWVIGWSNEDAAHNSATWPTTGYTGYLNVRTASALATSPLTFARFDPINNIMRVTLPEASIDLALTGTKSFSVSLSTINDTSPAATDAFGMYLTATNDGGHQNGSIALGDQGATGDTYTYNASWAVAAETTVTPTAGAVTATANNPSPSVKVSAGVAAVTATGYDATTQTSVGVDAGLAAVAATGYDATIATTNSQPAETTAYAYAAYVWSGR